MDEKKTKIDFIGIGAPKCGTTWIARCLSEHPQIYVPRMKELDFWNKKKIFYKTHEEWKYETLGIEWYEKQFASKKLGQICGEFSVYYLYDDKTPQLIKKHFPEAKIIVCLRNPTDRLFSHYIHTKYNLYTKKNIKWPSFEQIINEHPDFLELGYYYKYLKNFFDVFKKENIKIIFFDDLKKNPEKTINKLYSFLNVNNNYKSKSLHRNTNPTGSKTNPIKVHYFKFRNLGSSINIVRIIKKILIFLHLHNFLRKKIFLSIDNLINKITSNTTKPKMKKGTRKYLNKIYKPNNKLLLKKNSRNINIWS